VTEADSVRDGVARTAVRNLKVMARMGKFLEEAVQRAYPEFPLRSGVFFVGRVSAAAEQQFDSARGTLRLFSRRVGGSSLILHA